MSTRLQVIVDEAELAGFRRAAEREAVTLSEWVRRTLRRGEREIAGGDVAAKLDAVRAAVGHEFPTADIDEMLAEIERGYLADTPSS